MIRNYNYKVKSKLISYNTVFITLYIFICINIFGIFSFKSDRLWGPFNTYDIFIVVLSIHLLIYLKDTKILYIINNVVHLKYLFLYYLFILLVIVTMPIRGEISVIDSARVARDYLVLPLSFLIYYDILKNDNSNYYIKLFLFIAGFTSLQIIINAISPETISNIFPEIRAREGYKFGYQRNNLITAAMIFPHIATIYLFLKMNFKVEKHRILGLFILCLLGSALQGFRIYFLSMLLCIAIICVRKVQMKNLMKSIVIIVTLTATFTAMDTYIFNSQILGKVKTSAIEISGEREGTLLGRYERDNIFIYPMFYKQPLQGWGFIYHRSDYGKKLGMKSSRIDKDYALYSVDSGYLTVLIQFGLIGCGVILFFIFKMLLQFSISDNIYKQTAFYILIFLVVSLVTHGAFFSVYGIIPLCMFIGLTAHLINRHDQNSTSKKQLIQNLNA